MGYPKTTPPSRIVVRGPNFIGDAILAKPFFHELRARFPASSLTLVATPPSVEITQDWGLFDSVIPFADRSAAGVSQMARRIRAESFDLSVSLPSSVSAALLFYLARIPYRVGWAEALAKPFYHECLRWTGRMSGLHKSVLYQKLSELLPPGAEGAAQQSLTRSLEVVREPSQYWVFSPTASIALREWPQAIDFLRTMRQRFPEFEIKIVGKDRDKKWASALATFQDPKIQNLLDQTTLKQVQALCADARVVVAMDSGIAHVSATLANAPTLVVYGPGDPAYIAPLSTAPVVNLRVEDLACSPCEKAVCQAPYGYQVCLKRLEPERVMEGVGKFLS